MSKIKNAFNNGKALIAFITAGDPNLETTEKVILAMEKAGADLIEIGIPFSDPIAEGVIVQSANERALQCGITTDHVFDMVGKIRKVSNTPIAFMTYANLIYTYGTEEFLKKCNELQIDGIILQDVPYEEKEELAPMCEKYGVDYISIISSTTDERIAMIAKDTKGFAYCLSIPDLSQKDKDIFADIRRMVTLIKQQQDIPCVLGLDVSTAEKAKAVKDLADGVIVSNIIVEMVAKHGENSEQIVYDYIKSIKNALK